jgi:para-nitrobenzyl esterase
LFASSDAGTIVDTRPALKCLSNLGRRHMMQALSSLLALVAALGQADNPSTRQRPAGKPAAVQTPTPELRIDSGTIRGLVLGDKKDVHVYKGIPFAAPPVGELRWKPPQPVVPWKGVRDCFEFGAACPQKVSALFASIPEMALHAPTSEDCLFLNVWTPSGRKSEKLPVLYWIHGGGFVMGAASQPLYDGEELARLGCVVVSINYRLGLFGFLAHPALSQESGDKVSGNYGQLDQIEGLRWVKRNIALFGGDPEHVAIFGESAGAMSVVCLMVAPQAKGLFHGAVVQSAAGMNLAKLRQTDPGQESAEQVGQRLIAAAGITRAADSRQLRRLDPGKLVQAAPTEASPGAPVRLRPLTLRLGPIVDGHVIPDSPNAVFAAGRAHAVPVIVGNTRDEMAILLLASKMPADEAAYSKLLKHEFGELAELVAKAYPARDAREVRSAIIQLTTDLSFVDETRIIARAQANAGPNTYRYQFSRGTKRGFLQSLGAHHGAELAYLFQRPSPRDDEETMRISRAMGHYWINFARAGDPNGKDLPSWPSYRPGTEEIVDFADKVNVLKGPRNEQLDVIERVLSAPAAAGTRQAAR